MGDRVGLEDLREALGRSDPAAGLLAFRTQHCFPLRATEPTLRLLSALGTTRDQAFETAVLPALRSAVVARLDERRNKHLALGLLEKTWPFIYMPSLSKLPITAMLICDDKIPKKHLEELSSYAPYNFPYTDLPLSLKRRIWTEYPATFEAEIEEHMKRYVMSDRHADYFSGTILYALAADPTERRRRTTNSHLQDLCKHVGISKKLYQQCCKYIQDQVSHKREFTIGWRNLRYDLCLALREVPGHKQRIHDKFSKLCEIIRDSLSTEHISPDLIEVMYKTVYECFKGHGHEEGSQILASTSDVYARDICLMLSSGPALFMITRQIVSYIADPSWEKSPTLDQLCYLVWVGLEAKKIILGSPFLGDAGQLRKSSENVLRLIAVLIEEDKDRFEGADDAIVPAGNYNGKCRQDRLMRRLITAYTFDRFLKEDNVGVSRMRALLVDCYRYAHGELEIREQLLAEFLLREINGEPAPVPTTNFGDGDIVLE